MTAVMPGPMASDKARAADDHLPEAPLAMPAPPVSMVPMVPMVPMAPGTPVPLYRLRDGAGAPYGHGERA